MPHKSLAKLRLGLPSWVRDVKDVCLQKVLVEAIVARDSAISSGAERYVTTRKILDSGDATMEQVQFGRYVGADACKRVADALRKYMEALSIAAANTESSCDTPRGRRARRR